jgi:predicted nucleic acid-binding protein
VTIFVDTSALFAYYDADDESHSVIVPMWEALVRSRVSLLTTNYVLLEAASLFQRRLGLAWLQRLHTEARPLLDVVWVDDELHDLAMVATLAADRRSLSVVDHLSFETMRRFGIRYALAFDEHFQERGYELPPPLPPE